MIFSYAKSGDLWLHISPDPPMVSPDVPKIEDMYLYYERDSHYDILIKEAVKDDEEMTEVGQVSKVQENVMGVKECVTETIEVDKQENQEESQIFECSECKSKFDTTLALSCHMESHNERQIFKCDDCSRCFERQILLSDHVKAAHSDKIQSGEWTCQNCPYQTGVVLELMNHLKVTGHSPNMNVTFDKNAKDVIECYTCKLKFIGYYNLMDHRKSTHPSNKKCRNYPTSCKFGMKCWYVHQEDVNSAALAKAEVRNIECTVCDSNFSDNTSLEDHMKSHHRNSGINVQASMKNLKDCKGKESSDANVSSQKVQVFQEGLLKAIPPDQMKQMFMMIQNLYNKMNKIEEKFEDLMM